MKAFLAIIKRDLQLAMRQGMDSVMIVAFFVLAVMLFPIGVGPEANILARIAAGVIWVAALLSSMLSLERLFQIDYEDGSLELLALQPTALEVTVMAKITAHWLTTGLPLLIATPLLAVFMNLPSDGFWALVLTLAIGTPSLSLIGAIGAALILGSRRGGVLLSLLVLPLYIPILIFGVSAIDGAISGFPINAHLLIMSGIFLAALPLCLWAGTGAIRQALET
jgi:heme exporter protein B